MTTDMDMGQIPFDLPPEAMNPELAGNVTVEYLDGIMKQVNVLRTALEDLDRQGAPFKEQLEEMEGKLKAALEATGRKSYSSPFGSACLKEYTSVRMPQSLQDKEDFIGWLKEQGIFETTVSVHSRTLNALWASGYKKAVSEGKGAEFKVPGIKEVSVSNKLTFTRK